MNEFTVKRNKAERKERPAAQEHFIDLCRLLNNATTAEADPTGETFYFGEGAAKNGGSDGFAVVWKKDFFGWEYRDLSAACNQLLAYRDALESPPRFVDKASGNPSKFCRFIGQLFDAMAKGGVLCVNA
jgi:hypothetical protein